MYTVTVEYPCRCFLRHALPEAQNFASKEAAEAEAKSLHKYMESNFCKKHNFHLSATATGFKVSIREA